MLRTILRHEWKRLRLDRSLLVGLILLTGFSAFGLWNGFSRIAGQRPIVEQMHEDEAKRLDDVRRRLERIEAGEAPPSDNYQNPTLPFATGGSLAFRYAVMPPAPTAVLASGDNLMRPAYFGISLWSTKRHHWSNRRMFVKSDEIENPTNLAAGHFDFAFVVVYLLPLLVLALSYNLISEEKEQGTLALVMAQPVAFSRVVVVKTAWRFVILAVPAVVIAGGAVVLSRGFDGIVSRHFAIFIGAILAYLSFWLGVATAINAVGKSSAWNATALIALWIVFVLIVPTALNLTAATWYPTPPRTELIHAMRQAWIETDQLEGQTAARFYEDHPELLPANVPADVRRYAATTFYSSQLEIDRRIDPIFRRFDDQVDRQQAAIDKLSFLSPAIAIHAVLTDVAGTGPSRFRHFRHQVEDFHKQWRDFFVPRLFRLEKLRSSDVDSFPKFTYREEDSAVLVARNATRLLGIVIPMVVLSAISIAAVRRYNCAS
jgi:ABC-2 type transport system permease protein